MRCPQCGRENAPDAKFCGECGMRLASACPACGSVNPPSNRFCSACGALLIPAPPPARFSSPVQYTPRYIAEKILGARGEVEGERKQATVLFADLKSSMELIADRDPEDARALLDPVLERMIEAVHRYEGTVNQVMGDGIMAIFGAPLAHEDHAVRACLAALRMQDSIRRYAEEVRRTEGIPVQIRVGMNSGEVVIRSVSSTLRMEYMVVGQTTHLAARMEQMATAGSILLTAGTLRLAEGQVRVKALGPSRVKGLEEPVEVYELLGAEAAHSRIHAAAPQDLTHFVGREKELDQLREALERARTGRGQIVAVIGEPGVGKSRLSWEFTRSPQTQGWLILEGTSASYGKATTYFTLLGLLRGYFDVEPSDSPKTVREKITGKLLALDRTLEPVLPAVLSLFDLPAEDPQWQELDPSRRRQRTLDGIKRLLLRESQVQPLLLVMEDLHWVDGETQALLDSLVESLPTARLLLLVNHRPEYAHGWSRKTYYQEVRIDPLPPEGAEAMLQALLGTDSSLQPLKRLLIERTEGNPFFLEESIRTLTDTKALLGERGAYRLDASLGSLHIPATAQSILAARIDRLSPEDKRLLQTAAVIGNRVLLSLLQAVADQDEDTLQQSLARLQAAGFLYETGLFPDVEYSFRHALTHEVAYGSLLHARRRAVHARIVGAVETLMPDRLPEQVERLALHAVRGEVWEKAIHYLREAGMKALWRSANREAAAYFEQALTHLASIPETAETLAQAVDIRLELRNALVPLGESVRILTCLKEAESLARKLEDARRLGWISVYLSRHLWISGRSQESRRYAKTAYETADACADPSLKVRSSLYLGFSHQTSGDYERAATCYREVAQTLSGDLGRTRRGPTTLPVASALAFWARGLADQGEFEQGIGRGQEALHISEAAEHMYNLLLALWSLGYLYSIRGDFRSAVAPLERGLDLSRQWSVTEFSSLYLPWSLGYAYALSGRVDEGFRLLEQGIRTAEPLGEKAFLAMALVQWGEACLHAARVEEARAHAGRALALARDGKERGHEAYALLLLGSITAHADPPDRKAAEKHFQQAMTLAKELGMRPVVARCGLGLGQLYRERGLRHQAEETVFQARDLFREMKMTFWLETAEGELGARMKG